MQHTVMECLLYFSTSFQNELEPLFVQYFDFQDDILYHFNFYFINGQLLNKRFYLTTAQYQVLSH